MKDGGMSFHDSFFPGSGLYGSNRGSASSYGTYAGSEVKSAEEIRLEAAREAIRSRTTVFFNESLPGEDPLTVQCQEHLENLFSNIHAAKPIFNELGGLKGITQKLQVDPHNGIDSHSIPARQQAFGVNKIPEERQLTFYDFYRAAWDDKTIIMLSIAAAVSLVLGLTVPEPGQKTANYKTGWIEGFAILCSVFIVTSFTSVNDYRKDQSFHRLTEENSAQPITVLRDGKQQEIDVTEIVVGDIVHINSGLVMPVDGFVVTGKSVVMDESSVTGENHPSVKNAEQPWVLAGTVVSTAEEAYVVAAAVGPHSFGGKLLIEAQGGGSSTLRMTPLQVRLNDTADLIGRIGISAALFLFTLLCGMEIVAMMKSEPDASPRHFLDYFLLCVAVVVVAVPEGLPLAVTIALSYAQEKMHNDNNQVRRLVACETMGGATQICSDKTGTLTQNVMSVVQGYIGMRYFQVKRPGDLPEKIDLSSRASGEIPDKVRQRALQCIALNSSSEKVWVTSDTRCTPKPEASPSPTSAVGGGGCGAATRKEKKKKKSDHSRASGARSKSRQREGDSKEDTSEAFWKWSPDKGNKTDNALLDFTDRVLYDPACFSPSTDDSGMETIQPLPHQRIRTSLRSAAIGLYCIFPFTSDRKRMSVVIHEADAVYEPSGKPRGGESVVSPIIPPLSTFRSPSQLRDTTPERSEETGEGAKEEKEAEDDPPHRTGGPLSLKSIDHSPLGESGKPHVAMDSLSPSVAASSYASPFGSPTSASSGGALVHYVKGGSDRVLMLCNRYVNENGEVLPLDASATEAIYGKVSQLAKEANRTIGIAYTVLPPTRFPPNVIPTTEPEEELIWLGVIGIQDPLRPEVQEAVQKCQVAGVTVRMCTGDNLDTAVAIARQCGIFRAHSGDIAMTGEDFRHLVYDAFGDETRMDKFWMILKRMTVMGRSQPLDKQLLVLMLMMRGEVVAVTGDGTNDAPALRLAHVGFVMRSGTDVAVKSADIVLLDDNFRSVQRAVVWGRCVNDNIRKFVQLQLSINYVSVALTVVGSVLSRGASSPLTTIQLLWVNLIMDTLAALALATEEPTESCLLRGPTNRSAPLISRRMHANILLNALYIFVITLATQRQGADWFATKSSVELQTVVFNVFVLCILAHMVNCRKLYDEANMFEGLLTRSKPCLYVLAFCFLFQVLAVQTFGPFMNVQPLRLGQWIGCAVFAVEVWLVGLVVRLLPITEPVYNDRFDFNTLDEQTQDSLVKLSRDVTRVQESEEYRGQYLESASRMRAKTLWNFAIHHHITVAKVVRAFQGAAVKFRGDSRWERFLQKEQ